MVKKDKKDNEKQSQENFYSVILTEVMRHSSLLAEEKILYGHISSLCNRYGYCYASNQYFADLFKGRKKRASDKTGDEKISTRTICRWLKSLKEYGFVIYKNSKSKHRKIYLQTQRELQFYYDKDVAVEKVYYDKQKHSTTTNNDTSKELLYLKKTISKTISVCTHTDENSKEKKSTTKDTKKKELVFSNWLEEFKGDKDYENFKEKRYDLEYYFKRVKNSCSCRGSKLNNYDFITGNMKNFILNDINSPKFEVQLLKKQPISKQEQKQRQEHEEKEMKSSAQKIVLSKTKELIEKKELWDSLTTEEKITIERKWRYNKDLEAKRFDIETLSFEYANEICDKNNTYWYSPERHSKLIEIVKEEILDILHLNPDGSERVVEESATADFAQNAQQITDNK